MPICGKELVYALVIMLGPITFGTIMVYPSPTAKEIQSHHNLSEDDLTWSFYNSVSSLCAIAGPFISNALLGLFKQSRRKVVFAIAIASVIFWLLNLLTKVNIWAGIVIRALQGLVMGAYSSISPMFLVEIAPADVSGFFGCLNQIGIVLGMVFFDFIAPSVSYLDLDYIGASINALQAILIFFCAESPAADRDQNEDKAEDDKPKESLFQAKYMPGLFSGILMMLLQQFCGINAILTNLASLMSSSGLEMDGNYQAGIASSAQLISVFIGGILMDKLGRKICWMVSNSTIVIFLLIFALNTKYEWSTVLPLVCIFLYQLGFGLGMGPIPWFIIPEYFDDDVRSMATTIASASNWIFSFCIIFVWPAMKSGLGMFGSLLFFMSVTVGSVIFGIFCIHEPKNADAKEELSA